VLLLLDLKYKYAPGSQRRGALVLVPGALQRAIMDYRSGIALLICYF